MVRILFFRENHWKGNSWKSTLTANQLPNGLGNVENNLLVHRTHCDISATRAGAILPEENWNHQHALITIELGSPNRWLHTPAHRQSCYGTSVPSPSCKLGSTAYHWSGIQTARQHSWRTIAWNFSRNSILWPAQPTIPPESPISRYQKSPQSQNTWGSGKNHSHRPNYGSQCNNRHKTNFHI